MEAIKLAFDATVITMIFIGILAMLINLIPSKEDDEELETMMREEKKAKAGLYDEEGP